MKFFVSWFIVTLLMTTISATYKAASIEITKRVENSDLGVVNGLHKCGGPGRAIKWRVEGCSAQDYPCKIPADGKLRRVEFDFSPSQDADVLGIKFVVISDGVSKTIYDKNIVNSKVQGGESYTLHTKGAVTREKKGVMTAQFIFYRLVDSKVEVCGEADFELV